MTLALNRWYKGAASRKPSRRGTSTKLSIQNLEERATPAAGQIAFAVGTGAGVVSQVKVYDDTGALLVTFQPYQNSFKGGVNVAVGDVTGDGVLDVVTGAGFDPHFPQFTGGPHVEVFDGAGLLGGITTPLTSFFPYAQNFTGGVYVAAGDIDSGVGGSHQAEVVTGPGVGGGPDVEGFKFDPGGANPQNILSFLAFPVNQNFTGGVRIALADFGGDNGGVAGSKTLGDDEIACAPGPGSVGGPATGPTVQFWDYDGQHFDPDNYGAVTADIGPQFTGGLFVAGGYFTNNKDAEGFVYADLVISADAGGNPHQTIYRLDAFTSPDQREGATYIIAGAAPGIDQETGNPETVNPNTGLQSNVTVYGTSTNVFHGGVRVGVVSNPDPAGFDNLITGAGPGGGPHVKIFNGQAGTAGQTTLVTEFLAFDPTFFGGISIG
jgi:hypothetical protein